MRGLLHGFVMVGICTVSLIIGTNSISAKDTLTANDIDWCSENLYYYNAVGEYAFLESQSWSMDARVCTHLYKDPLWDHEGADRTARLVDRSAYYIEFEIQKSKERAESGRWNPDSAPVEQSLDDKIMELEHRVMELERELKNKDDLIMEQMKTIKELTYK